MKVICITKEWNIHQQALQPQFNGIYTVIAETKHNDGIYYELRELGAEILWSQKGFREIPQASDMQVTAAEMADIEHQLSQISNP